MNSFLLQNTTREKRPDPLFLSLFLSAMTSIKKSLNPCRSVKPKYSGSRSGGNDAIWIRKGVRKGSGLFLLLFIFSDMHLANYSGEYFSSNSKICSFSGEEILLA